MHFNLTYLLCLLTYFSSSSSHLARNINNRLIKDSIFVSWNKSTILSLRNSINQSSDNLEGELYKNRLVAFRSFLGIEDENKINTLSTRYTFLDEFSKNNNNKGKVYVIETNRSGEESEIINYLISFKVKDLMHVDYYKFLKGKWVKKYKTTNVNLKFEGNLSKYSTKFGKGFNQDDVIITEFINCKVKSSRYYLYATLYEIGCINKILSMR
jgi:hypothetical protein